MKNIGLSLKLRWARFLKATYQKLFAKHEPDKSILFIIGCQRSGTTMLVDVFQKDYSLKVYDEYSKLSSDHPTKLRLNSMKSLEKEINKNRVRNIIAKPLVETQNIDRLFDYFPKSQALWVYRNYQDVIASNLKKFGMDNGINTVRHIANKTPNNFRTDRISENSQKLISSYYSEDMSPYDAAALAWYARNVFFDERGLANNDRVKICKYEDMVKSPENTLRSIYDFIGASFPTKRISKEVHARSIKKGGEIELHPEIKQLCDAMLERMDKAFEIQQQKS